jgi:hypothetical protein
MISSTKREVPHDPREIKPKQRRYSILNREHPGSHSRKSTSTVAKMLKIAKSSSSEESLSWKRSTVLTKVSLRSSKVMKIVRIVKLNHHIICPFGVYQTYPQESKSYLMQ